MITSAAAVMVSVFAIFVTLSMIEMKMMGVALAASILIDATLIRLVILPAALVLLGERAWWPARIDRPRGALVEAEQRPGRGGPLAPGGTPAAGAGVPRGVSGPPASRRSGSARIER